MKENKNALLETTCVITILMFRYCHSYLVPFEIRTGIQMVQPFESRTLKSLIQMVTVLTFLFKKILTFLP